MALRKNRLYYRLLEALHEAGCPICLLLLEDGRRYLDSVMYERITDVSTRAEFRQAFGLCNLHTWQLSDVPTASAPDLGFAIIATDLLKRFEGSVREQRALSSSKLRTLCEALKRKLGKIPREATCPACRQTGATESYHLQQFLDCMADEEFRIRYVASQGICLPHFSLLATQLRKHTCFTILRELQVSKARSLRSRLEQFVERQDHRSREPLTTEHTNAWKRAFEFLAGKPGTFGNELGSHRSPRHKW